MVERKFDRNQFIQELNGVWAQVQGCWPDSSEPVQVNEIILLDACFGKIRNKYQQQSVKALRKLRDEDPDHPFFQPISLLGTIDQGRLETAHTNTLAWLFNPSERHGFGSVLALAIVGLHSQINLSDDDFSVSSATCEEWLADRTGRVDIAIRGTRTAKDGKTIRWLFVIEAKVDAIEHNEQLSRYANHFVDSNNNGHDEWYGIVIDNHDISLSSMEFEGVSWEKVASALWLAGRTSRNEHGYQFLRYYLSGIYADLCGIELPLSEDCIPRYWTF